MADRKKLSFGIKTTQYGAYEDILRIWLEADEIPSIEHAWLFDHPMPIIRADPSGPCPDGWTLLTALAAQTKRLKLGLMVASNANQTPPQLAKRAATVDVVSNGRLQLGIGAGGDERAHTAYGTDFYPPAEAIRRLGEACEIIRRMWTERVFDYDGRSYHFKEIYCEPKPVQKLPPFVIGGVGEQLTLRVVARHADIWNCPAHPFTPLDDFQRKNQIIDKYCAEIGRDPAEIQRSGQFIVDPNEDAAATREIIKGYILAGASHIVIGPRSFRENIAHWLNDEIIEPINAEVGA